MCESDRIESVLSRADLHALGWTSRRITAAVREGSVLRLRRDHYVSSPGPADAAIRVGGRLACVSVLALAGAFVLDGRRTHIHLDRRMSRLRSVHDHRTPMGARDRRTVRLHWQQLHTDDGTTMSVGLVDALIQAVRCQPSRAAIATIDSVLNRRILSPVEVRDAFALLPAKYQGLLDLVDGSAESGPETLMRLILRSLGLRFETQVQIDGVGRVDFLVEGWLIIECDSRAHHEGWAKQRDDRRRDTQAAAAGFTSLRFLAADLFDAPEAVAASVAGLVRAHR